MGYVYATINKDTLAHICKEKGVSSEFLASKTKLNMSRLNQWLTPTDINLPTINQAKKIAACLHIPFAGLYMNPCDIPLKRINYFQMLSHDMKQLELQRLKAKAMKIPPKIRVFSFVLLMCFLVTYLAIIIYEIIHSLGGMF